MSDPKYATIGDPAMNLAEECAELIKAISKLERFGPNNHHSDSDVTNLQRLKSIWRDVQEAFDRYIEHIDVFHRGL